MLNDFCGGREFFWHWVPPRGRSGCILLGVDLSVFVVESTQVGDFFVKFIVKNKCDGFRWVLMAVYGAAQPEHKDSVLAEFVNTCSSETLPLVVGGDFNIIRSPEEKNNDRFDSRWSLLFNACIETLNLRELALSGRRFTWVSSAEVPTYEKLDRILVSTDWEQKFLISRVEALTRELSDHTPLLLDTGNTAHRGNNHLFKFELGWLSRDGFHDMVAKVWQIASHGNSPMQRWQNKIRVVRRRLRGWAKNLVGETKRKKSFLLDQLDLLDRKAEVLLLSPQEVEYKNLLHSELTMLLREEELYWL